MKNFGLLLTLLFALPLMGEVRVVALSGSTRADSLNKKLVEQAAAIARQKGATVTIVDLKQFPMPFYDGDIETNQGMPEQAKRLRDLFKSSNAIIIASPEYNGSLSSVLKNALDWSSRNEKGGPSREAFQGKKVAIMSTSPGQGGGARGLQHLKSVIENVGGTVVATQVVVPNGQIQDARTQAELQKAITELLSP